MSDLYEPIRMKTQEKAIAEICPDENTALCNLCKVLTKEQMQRVTDYYYLIKWPYKTLYNW